MDDMDGGLMDETVVIGTPPQETERDMSKNNICLKTCGEKFAKNCRSYECWRRREGK